MIGINLGINRSAVSEGVRAALGSYAVDGVSPDLVYDPSAGTYYVGGARTKKDSASTFSRSGNATMVDSDGLLKWAPHNLLPVSSDLSDAAWTKDNVSVSGETITDSSDGSPTQHNVRDSSAVSGSAFDGMQLTTKARVKAGTKNWMWLAHLRNTLFSAYFNLSDGSVGTVSPGCSASIASDGDGYYIITLSLDAGNSATGSSHQVYLGLADGDGSTTYTGDGTGTALCSRVWSYRSDLGGMVNNPARGDSYVPTTGTAKYLSRVGHHVYNGSEWVNEGEWIEPEARTNIIEASNDFSDAFWNGNNLVALTSNAAISPDGESNATKVDSAGSNSYVAFTYAADGTPFTASVYAKEAEARWIRISVNAASTNGAWYDLQTGTVGTVKSGITANIQDVGNGWYRCMWTIESSPTSSVPWSIGVSSADDTTTAPANGDGVYLYGAQLEDASTPSSYIPTAGSTVTRAADTLSIPASNLPYPTKIPYGDELWSSPTLGTDWTDNGGGVYEYDGTNDDDLLVVASGLSSGTPVKMEFTVSGLTSGTLIALAFGPTDSESITADGTYTAVIEIGNGNIGFNGNTANSGTQVSDISVKEITAGDTGALGSNLVPDPSFDDASAWDKTDGANSGWEITGGQAVQSGSFDSTDYLRDDLSGYEANAVYQIYVDIESESAGVEVRLGAVATGSGIITLSGTGPQTAYGVWTGSNSTLFIRTPGTSSTATLNSVRIRKVTPAALTIAMEGMMTYADNDSGAEARFIKWTESSGNQIFVRLITASGRTGSIAFYQRSEGTEDSVESSLTAYSPGVNVPFNIASRHTSAEINGAVDGTALTADTTPTALADLSAADMDLASAGGGIIIKTLRIWGDFEADDTQLEDLTS